VDETYIGGEEPGRRGGRAKGKKTLVGIAVEVREPKGPGRCRMRVLPDVPAASRHPFVTDHVEPGATVVTDAWQGFTGIEGLGYTRVRHSQRAARLRGDDPYGLFPGVHRVAALAKRWLLGTHQGSVGPAHLQAYLDEFVFRFNRRTSPNRGLVFHRVLALAIGHQPVRYRDPIVDPQPKSSALDWPFPTCAAQGCGVRADFLQTDHRADWAKTHVTIFDLLDRLCRHHHGLKTRQNWALVKGSGKRLFVPPDDPRHPGNAGKAGAGPGPQTGPPPGEQRHAGDAGPRPQPGLPPATRADSP
jgi:hypothetical protein